MTGRMTILPRHTDLPMLVREPGHFIRRYRWSLLLLLAAATADAITTYLNVRRYTTIIEVHPVQRWVFEALGPAAGVPVAKMIQVAVAVGVAAWWRPWCRYILLLCAGLYALAAVSNHFEL